jgi:hypothetical protein
MSDTNSSSGIGFLGLLAILFIGLKLTHFIAWSWWWVLAPLWIGFAVLVVILFIALVFIGLGSVSAWGLSRRR